MYSPIFPFVVILGIIPIIFLYLTRKKLDKYTFAIEPFLWVVIFSSLYEYFFGHVLGYVTENWPRLYILLEFCALFYFYFKILNRQYKLYLICSGAFFTLVYTALLLLWDDWNKWEGDSILSVIEVIFVYFSSIFWFKELFTKLPEKSLTNFAAFYFIAGFILYFSGTLFLFLEAETMMESGLDLRLYWNLIVVFNGVLRIFLIIGIWKGQQKLTQYSG